MIELVRKMERVLIIGNGAREHALGWLIKSFHKQNVELFFTGNGNAGTAKIGKNLYIDHFDFAEQNRFCQESNITYIIPGSENIFAAGIVDYHRQSDHLIFGPTQAQTQLESSKYFSARFNEAYDIPQPKWATFTDIKQAHLQAPSLPFRKKVYKGELLARGTAVLLPNSLREEHQAIDNLMNPDNFHGSGAKRIIVQERIEDGFEITAQALTDGEVIIELPEVMDFKKRFNEDHPGDNPNTGGKGSFTPVPAVTPRLRDNIYQIFQKVTTGMKAEGLGCPPLINLNLKVPDEDHPKVLEINVRFGDPEFEALAMLVNFDLLRVLKATSQKNQLNESMVRFRAALV